MSQHEMSYHFIYVCICRTKTIKTHVYIQWSSNIMCTIVYVYMVSPWFTLEKISRKYSEWRRWKVLNGPNGLGRITINNLTKTPKWVGTAWNSKSSSGKQQTVTKVWWPIPLFSIHILHYTTLRTAGQVPSLGFSEAAAASQTCTTQTGTSQGC